MNWSLIGFIVLISLILLAFGVMIYFEYIDPLRRQAQWQREQENNTSTVTSDGYPAVTWLLESKFRELSDEEILKEWFYEPGKAELWETKEILNFARTVIRKAQER